MHIDTGYSATNHHEEGKVFMGSTEPSPKGSYPVADPGFTNGGKD